MRTSIPSSQRSPTRAPLLCAALAAALLATGCREARDPAVVRIGHFPNITHAHGLVAHALSRRGEGVFEKHLGAGRRVEWYVFHAGPSAMEALLSGSIDATYVGPGPALNAHLRSGGEEVRILAGATLGGAGLVVRRGAGIRDAADLRARRIATPQLGNTQDVACRAWLAAGGLRITQTGGDAHVVPTANPDQLTLFRSGGIDAAWTVEPWVSRLELEADGEVLVEESSAVTTVLACSARLLRERAEVAEKLRQAHGELTGWMAARSEEARELVRAEFEAITRRSMPRSLVDRCWKRMTFTVAISLEPLVAFAEEARAAGFMERVPDLGRLLAR